MKKCLLGSALIFTLHFSLFAQPVLLKEVNPPDDQTSYSLSFLNSKAFKDRLYFLGQSYETGFEIFSTDGTEAGTDLFKEFVPGQRGISSQVSFGATDDFMLLAFSTDKGSALWKTDGTPEGTKLIGSMKSYQSWPMVELNGILYFWSTDDEHGVEPWRSDGTAEGTYMVKDLMEGAASSVYGQMTAADNQIFFTANDGVGVELWRTDGTSVGTTLVRDFQKITPNSNTVPAIVGNNAIIF